MTLKLKVIHIIQMTLLISGSMLANDSILVSILTLSQSGISENPFSITSPWWLTLIFEVKLIFFQISIIFKVKHHSYIICFRFAGFPDFDYVKISTKIKSEACIQPEIMKVIWKYVWPRFSRSTIMVRWHVSHIEIYKHRICSNRLQHCVFITYTTHDEQRVTINNFDLDFEGHPSRSSDKFW